MITETSVSQGGWPLASAPQLSEKNSAALCFLARSIRLHCYQRSCFVYDGTRSSGACATWPAMWMGRTIRDRLSFRRTWPRRAFRPLAAE